jgi:cephalosporin hydroxylase
MTLSMHDEISRKLWRGYDPYYGFPYKTVKPDLQGWSSQHPYLADTISARRPKVVVEVGVWKGASVLELARSVRANGLDAVVIAVDTWLGAWDHWADDHWHGELGFEFGYPTIYRTFLANMILGEVQDIVIPLPLDSVNAQHTLKRLEIFPDVVHIDGAHDFDTVLSDLTHWWSILATGGTVIMDDYFESITMWPDVYKAVRTFLERVEYTDFEAEQPKCRFVKCAGPEPVLATFGRVVVLSGGQPSKAAKDDRVAVNERVAATATEPCIEAAATPNSTEERSAALAPDRAHLDRIDATAVRAVYRAILGREPESEGAVLWHLQHAANLETLLRTVTSSREFKLKSSAGGSALRESILDLLSHFSPRKIVGYTKIRVGNEAGDGGYVMVDDFEGVVAAISAGIENEASWDQEIANRGIDVYQFDHTVTGSPVANDRFHFYRHEISTSATQHSDSIKSALEKIPTQGGRFIMKIDIEGAEWQALDAATVEDLRRFAQVVGEFHGFSNIADAEWRARALRTITKLRSVFEVVHVHGNNWAPLQVIANIPFPDVIEVAFANRSLYQFDNTTEVFPTPLDRPNDKSCPDIFLGSFRFKSGLARDCALEGKDCQAPLRIIASMTTLPSRIDRIRPALESVMNQTIPIEHIEINVPYLCVRTNELYVIPKWLEGMDRVKIFRTDDHGPITKVAPTLLRHKDEQHTYIWSVDDDFAYPPNQLEMLSRFHRSTEYRILTRHGGTFDADGNVTFSFGEMEVSMFEGFGTVLYPPGCIGEDFLEYVEKTSENIDCRKNDDVVLSFYFASRRIPIYLCNRPSETEAFYPTGSLHLEEDAISRDSEHLPRIQRIWQFLNSQHPGK